MVRAVGPPNGPCARWATRGACRTVTLGAAVDWRCEALACASQAATPRGTRYSPPTSSIKVCANVRSWIKRCASTTLHRARAMQPTAVKPNANDAFGPEKLSRSLLSGSCPRKTRSCVPARAAAQALAVMAGTGIGWAVRHPTRPIGSSTNGEISPGRRRVTNAHEVTEGAALYCRADRDSGSPMTRYRLRSR